MNTHETFLLVLSSVAIVLFGLLYTYIPLALAERKKRKILERLEKFDYQFQIENSPPQNINEKVRSMLYENKTSMEVENRKRILLIDDEPDILEFLSYNLRKKGHEIITAADGLQGLAAAIQHTPDIIIADILMPQMNGIAMCGHMKSNDQLKNIPIVFLSAVQDDYNILAAMEAGGNHYISKPVRFELLYDTIFDFFQNKGLQLN